MRSPWGGGNQWIEQIARSLRFHGYSVRFSLDDDVDCVLIADARSASTATFDVASIEAFKARHPGAACLHRVNDNDKHRGSSFRDAVQAAASRVADQTVFLSQWLCDYEAERWFDRTKPHAVIINGADPRFFHPLGSIDFRRGGPMRLVTHHWSREWNKGFAVYAEIDRLIAEGTLRNVELWVIGRWPETIVWKSARTFPACGAPELGQLLRQCHVYVTGSQWESGGMHFIEGAQCGLPVLYHMNGGGIVEVARAYGFGYADDIRTAIVEIQDRYAELRTAVLATPPSGDRMCLEYRQLIQQTILRKRRAL